MDEISIILKNSSLITSDEFRALNLYSHCGQLWTLIYRQSDIFPQKITHRATEYIFDPESLTYFFIISKNVLVTWDTAATKHLGMDDEFCLQDSLYIRPYSKNR